VVGVSLGGNVVEEGIVGLHVVGLDVEVVGGGIAGDDRLGRLAEAAREAGLIAEGANKARTEGALGDGGGDGAGDLGQSIEVDEAKELVVLVVEADAAAGDLIEVDAGLRAARPSR
jgi:hypothetical protein